MEVGQTPKKGGMARVGAGWGGKAPEVFADFAPRGIWFSQKGHKLNLSGALNPLQRHIGSQTLHGKEFTASERELGRCCIDAMQHQKHIADAQVEVCTAESIKLHKFLCLARKPRHTTHKSATNTPPLEALSSLSERTFYIQVDSYAYTTLFSNQYPITWASKWLEYTPHQPLSVQQYH